MFTLQFGTYSFPNLTFECKEHRISAGVPVADVPRRDGGAIGDGYLTPKKFSIRGQIFSTSDDSNYSTLNIMKRALHNRGQAAQFKYKSDRYVMARLAPEGIMAVPPQEGTYQKIWLVEAYLISESPYAVGATEVTTSGSRNNNSAVQSVSNDGVLPTNPVFVFVAGTWPFQNDLFVRNTGNCHYLRFQGAMAAGQTLVIDCDLQCVLLHEGLTMVDAISLFAGDLNFELLDGSNSLVIDAATLDYDIKHRPRWYV